MKENNNNQVNSFNKKSWKFIFTPGPTMVPPRILNAMSKQIINPDLDPDFPHWFEETAKITGNIIKTKKEVLLLPGEGMLGLCASLNSIVKPKDKVLVLASGIFGYGFADMVKKVQGEPIIVGTEGYDEVLDVEKVKEAIDNNPDISAITVIHCETPSGTLNPMKEIGKACSKSNAVLICDAVSSNGGAEVRTDEWNIDINLGASQKCFSAPPGIAFMSLSDKAIEVINDRKQIPTFYSDLSIWTKSWIANRTLPYTHSISDLYAFREGVDIIQEEGIENVFKRHKLISNALITAIEEIGLEIYPKQKEFASPTVTTVKTPKKVDGDKFISHMWNKYGVLIAGAWGPDLSGKVLRLGNMGYAANIHLTSAALAAFERTLFDFGIISELGNAVGTFMDKV